MHCNIRRYETGRGGKLPQDSALAAAYFSIAASHGDRDAQRALDVRYSSIVVNSKWFELLRYNLGN